MTRQPAPGVHEDFAARVGTPSPESRVRVKLPPLGEELYEFYPNMSAQTHEALVKDYARKAVRAALATTEGSADGD